MRPARAAMRIESTRRHPGRPLPKSGRRGALRCTAQSRGLSYPGKLLRPMQALAHSKELVRISNVESGPIVVHLVDGLGIFAPTADPDARLRSLCAVLQGVADEVAPHLTNRRRISGYRRQLGNFDQRRRAAVQRLRFDSRSSAAAVISIRSRSRGCLPARENSNRPTMS